MIQPLHGHILLMGTIGFQMVSSNIIQILKFLIHFNSIHKTYYVCLCEKKKSLANCFKKWNLVKNILKFY